MRQYDDPVEVAIRLIGNLADSPGTVPATRKSLAEIIKEIEYAERRFNANKLKEETSG